MLLVHIACSAYGQTNLNFYKIYSVAVTDHEHESTYCEINIFHM